MGEGPSADEMCLGALAGGLYGLAVHSCLVLVTAVTAPTWL